MWPLKINTNQLSFIPKMVALASPTTVFLTPVTKPFIKTRISNITSTSVLKSKPYPSLHLIQNKSHLCCSAVQDIVVEEEKEEKVIETSDEEDKRRKLYVVNLPWKFTAPEIKKLFEECGKVKDVEVMKQKNGLSRGFGFVTMSSAEEAQAAVDKFNSYELMGRTIKVEFAKSFRPPAPPPPPDTPKPGGYKIYAANLAWKVRSANLKEFFSDKYNPVSARVVLDSTSGKSAGYGFVGFATMEEAEMAISEMNGKELIGRPLRLKISERAIEESKEGLNSNDTDLPSEEEAEAATE